MSAATILFIDIVSFSKKSTKEQKELIQSFTTEVTSALKKLSNNQNIVALPTGDGLALAFLHSDKIFFDHYTLLNFIFKIHEWAFIQSSSLRVGVHVGDVQYFIGINKQPNVCGDTINYAQRVMDATNPQQTLYSETAFRHYVGENNHDIAFEKFNAKFSGPIQVSAKHDLQISVYKLFLDPPQSFCSNDNPNEKRLILLKHRQYGDQFLFDVLQQPDKEILYITIMSYHTLTKIRERFRDKLLVKNLRVLTFRRRNQKDDISKAMSTHFKEDEDVVVSLINKAWETWTNLKKVNPNILQLKEYSSIPTMQGFIVKDEYALIELLTYRSNTEDRAAILVRKDNNKELFDLFSSSFEKLWSENS